MADTVRYGKPCMTNLPPELGRAIIKEMLNTPKPDRDVIEKRIREPEKENLEVRKREMGGSDNGIAILSSFDNYTTFSFRGKKLTFRTCKGLERYTKVLLWDNGYIEVMAKYKQEKEEIEEYIDLAPVLDGLNMNKEEFLSPIKGVKIEYA